MAGFASRKRRKSRGGGAENSYCGGVESWPGAKSSAMRLDLLANRKSGNSQLVPLGSDACKLSRTGWTRVNELLRMPIGATVSFAAPSLKRRNAEIPSAGKFWVQSDQNLLYRSETAAATGTIALCLRERGRADQLAGALPGRLIHVDGKIPECSTGALRLLRACTTTFAGPDIGIGAVPLITTTIVKRLPGGAAIAVAFRKISEMLRAVEFHGVPSVYKSHGHPSRQLHTRSKKRSQFGKRCLGL